MGERLRSLQLLLYAHSNCYSSESLADLDADIVRMGGDLAGRFEQLRAGLVMQRAEGALLSLSRLQKLVQAVTAQEEAAASKFGQEDVEWEGRYWMQALAAVRPNSMVRCWIKQGSY